MLARARSVALIGVDAVLVEVEVDVSPGLPAFTVVGLPDQAVSEARERVRAAIRNAGLPFPAARITVNLAPADLRKEGPLYDLPIALGVLAAQEVLPREALEETIMAGELALDGSLRPIAGAINLSLLAAAHDFEALLPEGNAQEAALIEGVSVYGAANLRGAVAHLSGAARLPVTRPEAPADDSAFFPDLSDLKGQAAARRALEVALAGGHNLLMVGSPGSGKTMLARRAPGLLPPLTRTEALEVTRIHSAAGLLTSRGSFSRHAPFRAPHHTVSDAGLIGGGSIPKPGEVSLSHRGLLFLDEFPEFSRKAPYTLWGTLRGPCVADTDNQGQNHLLRCFAPDLKSEWARLPDRSVMTVARSGQFAYLQAADWDKPSKSYRPDFPFIRYDLNTGQQTPLSYHVPHSAQEAEGHRSMFDTYAAQDTIYLGEELPSERFAVCPAMVGLKWNCLGDIMSRDGQRLLTLEGKSFSTVQHVSQDGSRLYILGNTLQVWDTQTGKRLASIHDPQWEKRGEYTFRAHLTPDNTRAALLTYHYNPKRDPDLSKLTAYIYRLSDGKLLGSFSVKP